MDVISELGGIVDIGAGAVLVWVIVLLFTGGILTRSMHDKIVAILQETIAELRDQLKSQNDTVNPAIQRVLDSLPVKSEEPRKGA